MTDRREIIKLLRERRMARGGKGLPSSPRGRLKAGMIKPITKGTAATRKYKMPLQRAVKEAYIKNELKELIGEIIAERRMARGGRGLPSSPRGRLKAGVMQPISKGTPATRKYKMPLKRAVKEDKVARRVREILNNL